MLTRAALRSEPGFWTEYGLIVVWDTVSSNSFGRIEQDALFISGYLARRNPEILGKVSTSA